MPASTHTDGQFDSASLRQADRRAFDPAVHPHRSGRRLAAAALLPSIVYVAMLLTIPMPAALAEGMDDARDGVQAEAAASVVRKPREGRLSQNGTRSLANDADPASIAGSATAANPPAPPAAQTSSNTGAAAPSAPAPARAVPAVATSRHPVATDCFAGCITPDRPTASNRATAAAKAPAPRTGAGNVIALTAGTQGGANCIAGCYGSGMEKVGQGAAVASARPTMTTTEAKEGTSIKVLRGATKRRSYGSAR